MEQAVRVDVVDILARVKKEQDSSDDDQPLSRTKQRRRDPAAVYVKLEACAELDRVARRAVATRVTSPAPSDPGDRRPRFGDGSAFRPGWEHEVYRYKRSLRMPPRLLSPWLSGSLPDLDPPASPAPSSRAHTAPLDADRAGDSDLDSVSRLCYDSEASSSTVLSYTAPPLHPRKSNILDILINKYGRHAHPVAKPEPLPPVTPPPPLAPRRAPTLAAVFGDTPRTSKHKLRKARHKTNPTRDGLRSTSLKKCDARGRLLRLRKRNNLAGMSLPHAARVKTKIKRQQPESTSPSAATASTPAPQPPPPPANKRFKRLFTRRKLSSGFDYIRKKKKNVSGCGAGSGGGGPVVLRRPTPESVQDISKELQSWFVNKSVGETRLHRAARLGYVDCAAYCLEVLGAPPSERDNAGYTPLHVAAARGHAALARLLLQYGANESAAASGGVRPLHEASESDSAETVRLLLSYGADPTVATYSGQTPLQLSQEAGANSAAALLAGHLADLVGRPAPPWRLPPPHEADDKTCDVLRSPPPASPPPASTDVEFLSSEAPLPAFYSLHSPCAPGLWCLLHDVAASLQIKSRESVVRQVGGCGEEGVLLELRTCEFLERARCHQLLGAGEKVNVRASRVALVRVTDRLRRLLGVTSTLVASS